MMLFLNYFSETYKNQHQLIDAPKIIGEENTYSKGNILLLFLAYKIKFKLIYFIR